MLAGSPRVPVLRSESSVSAPPTLVAGVLRDTAAAIDALGRVRCEFRAPVRLLAVGDEVEVTLRGPLGPFLRCRTRITRAGAGGLWSELASGPAAVLRHATTVVADGAGSRVRDELTWEAPFGPLGRISDPVVRAFLRRVLDARSDVLDERVARLGRAPVVVGAAIVRDGRLLAARRSEPPELAGRWELPGGGVEPGETEPDALRRECREEMGTEIEVGFAGPGLAAGAGPGAGAGAGTGAGAGAGAGIGAGDRVGTDLPIGDPDGGRVLRLYRARLRPGAPEPEAREHSELRWVGPAEVAGLGWLDADRAVVADLRELLGARSAVPDR